MNNLSFHFFILSVQYSFPSIFPETSCSAFPMLLHFFVVGLGSIVVVKSTSVENLLDSMLIDKRDDSLSFDCNCGSDFLYAFLLFLFVKNF